ncbi:Nramp family divalent metal transporter [candidate division KSB1 bacterium]|nr:Nramp family divalent metal transporter [candidate division KSB1 bacterium]
MSQRLKGIIKSAGPGFIIASVVLGPGSITTASKIGAEHGYQLLWVIVFAAIGMAMYTTMSTRYGISHEKSILQTTAETYGRWFAGLIGISAFLTATSFQFGNNLGVATAMQTITGINETVWPLILTPTAIVLIFFAKNLYKVIEKIMMVLVMTMIVAFFLNLIFAKPDIVATAKGFLPISLPRNAFNEMAALVGTTFVLHVCLYHSYLVQNKGWGLDDYKQQKRDSISGIIMLGGISMLVILTSAAALNPKGIMVSSAADMAIQLEALFGSFAKYVFSIGLFAAAFSSLLVNAVIGGGLLSDGLGLGRTMDEKYPKIFSIIVLLIGMIIAVFFRGDIVYALVLAQASSLFAVPAIGIGLFLLLNNKKVMGDLRNNLIQNIVAGLGLILILVMVYYMYHRLIMFIGKL